jgi:hypothetical protein
VPSRGLGGERVCNHEYDPQAIRAHPALLFWVTLVSSNTLKSEIHLHNLFNNSVPTSQESHRVSITKTNWLMLFRAIIVVSPGSIPDQFMWGL